MRCCPENRGSIVFHLVVFFATMISALHRKLRHPSEFDAMVLLLMISSVRRSRATRGFYLHYDSELEREVWYCSSLVLLLTCVHFVVVRCM